MENQTACQKCGGTMIVGFVADYTYGGIMPNSWVEGEPEKSFWTGTKVSDKEQFRIKTFRCRGCGFLEFYANDAPAGD